MRIELEQTMTPEDMGPNECSICGETYEVGTVTVWLREAIVAGDPWVCPACVEVLGAYRPDMFPSIEEFRRLEGQWQTTIYSSGVMADAAWAVEFLSPEERKRRQRCP
jgi:hypothetical protein